MAVAKGGLAGATGNWPGIGSSIIDLLSVFGIKEDDIASKAWILVQSSLLEVMQALNYEKSRELTLSKQRFNDLCFCLDQALETSELSLTPDFFTNPKDLPILEKVTIPFIEWSCGNGLAEQDANKIGRCIIKGSCIGESNEMSSLPIRALS